MLELAQFFFSGFWHWVGGLVYLLIIGASVEGLFKGWGPK